MNKTLVLISLLIPIFSTLTAMERQPSDDGVTSTQQQSCVRTYQEEMVAYLKYVSNPYSTVTLQGLIDRTPDEELWQIQQLLQNRNSHSKHGNKQLIIKNF